MILKKKWITVAFYNMVSVLIVFKDMWAIQSSLKLKCSAKVFNSFELIAVIHKNYCLSAVLTKNPFNFSFSNTAADVES